MATAKRWHKWQDFTAYVAALEECYGIRIEVDTAPAAELQPNEQYLHMKAFWLDTPEKDGKPMCYSRYVVLKWPHERVGPSLLAAASQFTYLCIEAHIEALPETVSLRN